MGKETNIAWTDHTFNPWIGCTKVSDGCKNCYAEELDNKRFSKTLGGATKENPISHWGKGATRHRTSADYWKQPLAWNKAATNTDPHDPRYGRPRVFCASQADIFDSEVD